MTPAATRCRSPALVCKPVRAFDLPASPLMVIVGLFTMTWLVTLAVWRWGRIEERWS